MILKTKIILKREGGRSEDERGDLESIESFELTSIGLLPPSLILQPPPTQNSPLTCTIGDTPRRGSASA